MVRISGINPIVMIVSGNNTQTQWQQELPTLITVITVIDIVFDEHIFVVK